MRELKKISYSYLHALACPYQAFLRYEAAIKSPSTPPLALGNALHTALEEVHKQPVWTINEAIDIFVKEFRRIITEDEVFISWAVQKKSEAEGIEMLELYNYGIQTGKILDAPLFVEKEFELPFEDEIVVVGKIDKIEQDEDGEYIVTDYKSGKTKPDEWFLSHDLQFSCYAWACQQLFDKLPKKLIWHHLRTGEQLVTTRTQRDVDELQRMLHNAITMSKEGIRHKIYHTQVCKWCDFSPYKGSTVCDDRELEDRLVKDREVLVGATTNEQ